MSDLTSRQETLRLNTLFVDAWKGRDKQSDGGSIVTGQGSKIARWVARALTAEAELERRTKEDRLTVAEQMVLALQDDHDRLAWSKRKWADYLGCSASAVGKTKLWDELLAMRSSTRLAREELVQGDQPKKISGGNSRYKAVKSSRDG